MFDSTVSVCREVDVCVLAVAMLEIKKDEGSEALIVCMMSKRGCLVTGRLGLKTGSGSLRATSLSAL